MNEGIISMRYAKALLAYAEEQGAEERLYTEMNRLTESFREVVALRETLNNPVVTESEKRALICSAGGGEVSDAFVRFVELVLSNRRESFLQSMAWVYAELYRKHKQIHIVQLQVARQVPAATLERMKHLVGSRTSGIIEFETRVEPRLAGGFVFQIDTYRLDASVATQLRRVKQQFIEKNKRIV